MKRYIESIIGFTIEGIDGEIGKVKEFYFDDKTCTIRYYPDKKSIIISINKNSWTH